ncbi:MAG: hypothetical protein L0H93_16725 [Nocardioides sp.]|nr:hypothetical protein [Nocardioides sp.]
MIDEREKGFVVVIEGVLGHADTSPFSLVGVQKQPWELKSSSMQSRFD